MLTSYSDEGKVTLMEVTHSWHKRSPVLTAQVITQLMDVCNDFHALGV